MSIEWGDVPAWGALAISLSAAVSAVLALRHARDAASASKISAQAAVRQAAAAERQVEVAEAALKVAEVQASAAQTTLVTGPARAALSHPTPYVAWWLENPTGQAYVLRNIGNDTARNVEIDESRIRCILRGDTTASEIPPQASMKLMMAGSLGAAKPDELWVRWEGHPEWVAVPVP